MPAYNRITQQFQDGFDLDAADLNAMKQDIQSWFTTKLNAVAETAPIITATFDSTLSTFDNATLTWDVARALA